MKRFVLMLCAGTFLLVAVAAGVIAYNHWNRERIFYEQAFIQLRDGSNDEPMITLDFTSGGSASVMLEHSCCTGAGFDAVAIRTSDGQEFIGDKNFCGLEGFYSGLEPGATEIVNSFVSFLDHAGYKRRGENNPQLATPRKPSD